MRPAADEEPPHPDRCTWCGASVEQIRAEYPTHPKTDDATVLAVHMSLCDVTWEGGEG